MHTKLFVIWLKTDSNDILCTCSAFMLKSFWQVKVATFFQNMTDIFVKYFFQLSSLKCQLSSNFIAPPQLKFTKYLAI